MKDKLKEIIEEMTTSNIIKADTIPNIDLYIDQLLKFIEDNSYCNKENHLTKSMVNNYCKNKVIPKAEQKKYTKNHIMLLILIYNTKSILSISEIANVIQNIDISEIESFYSNSVDTLNKFNQNFKTEVLEDYQSILETYNTTNDKSQIGLLAIKLSIEASYKKMLAELLIKNFL